MGQPTVTRPATLLWSVKTQTYWVLVDGKVVATLSKRQIARAKEEQTT